MKKFLLVSTVLLIFSCTNEVKEELNAVNNEAKFQKNVENFMEFTESLEKRILTVSWICLRTQPCGVLPSIIPMSGCQKKI